MQRQVNPELKSDKCHKCGLNTPLSGTAFFYIYISMTTNVYLDESGDLGWILDKPYRNGGSSRYLTIAFVVCPSEKKHLLRRIVKDVYRRIGFNPKMELKGSALSVNDKCFFAEKVRKLVSMNPDIAVGSITVNKSKDINLDLYQMQCT